MRRATKIILAALFGIALVSPTLQMLLRGHVYFARDLPLGGYDAAPVRARPTLSWRAWTDERFQTDFQAWFAANVGLRAHMIRTDQTINFFVFGDGTGRIVRGRDDYLFEPGYILMHETPAPTNRAVAETVARDLRAISEKLRAKNVGLVVLISASKAEVYPDKIPRAWKRTPPAAPTGPTRYEMETELLETYGIPFVNGQRSLIEARRAQPSVPWFPRGGTHWSHYAACVVLQRVLATWKANSSALVPELTCVSGPPEEEARYTDRDLAGGLNLWYERPLVRNTPLVRPSIVNPSSRPRILFVGSSFSEPLMNVLKLSGLTDVRRYYYYQAFDDGAGRWAPINRVDRRWVDQVLDYDLVVLEGISYDGLENSYFRDFAFDMRLRVEE